MPPDSATTVWFVTFFNPYEFAGMRIEGGFSISVGDVDVLR